MACITIDIHAINYLDQAHAILYVPVGRDFVLDMEWSWPEIVVGSRDIAGGSRSEFVAPAEGIRGT